MAGHEHSHTNNVRALTFALALTGTYLIAEVVAGIMFRSLALLSDAAHMLTDAAALAIALAAIKVGQKAADDRRTFGYRRFEILAAAFNALLLIGIAIYVLVEGVQRIFAPVTVESDGMFIVALIGLGVNLVAMRVLSGGKDKSLNVKGAYLEVWADLIGSIGVLGGAVLIRFTGWFWVDAVVAIGIGLWVLPRTWVLLRDTTNILLEGAPAGVAFAAIRDAILATPGVAGLHDLHVWVSGADQPSCTVHVTLNGDVPSETVRTAITVRLVDEFRLDHLTVQTEAVDAADHGVVH